MKFCVRIVNFIGHNFQSCSLLKFLQKHRVICHVFWLSPVGMDFDKLVCVLLKFVVTFWGGNKLFSIWAANIMISLKN